MERRKTLGPSRAKVQPAGSGRPAAYPAEMADHLGSLTDREDLARLFEKNVDLRTIVQLMGRQVPRETIRSILDSADPSGEIRRLLN